LAQRVLSLLALCGVLSIAPSVHGAPQDSKPAQPAEFKRQGGVPSEAWDPFASGLTLSGAYYGAQFSMLESASGPAGSFDQGFQLNAALDLHKAFSQQAFDGLKLTVQGRWRDPREQANPNNFVQGSSLFNPSNWTSGTGFRLLQANFELDRPLRQDPDVRLWFKAGWVQPRYEFILQPDTDLILNNAVNSGKGVGGNIPFSSSFSTWGGMVRLTSPSKAYLKAGLFMAYPNATLSSNHGLWFQGDRSLPGTNATMAMVELGLKPLLTPQRLPGVWAVGVWAYNNVTTSAQRSPSILQSPNWGLQQGFYLQLDQSLIQAAIQPSSGPRGWSPGFPLPPKSVPSRLTTFNLLAISPAFNNQFPVYWHSGLRYSGLFSAGANDALVVALAYGAYSAQESSPSKTSTVFLEAGYHFPLLEWSGRRLDLYPFFQWDLRPAGSLSIPNALVLGVGTRLAF